MAQRTPLQSWRYPERKALYQEVFASGRPSFAPFPDVTTLLNAALCPVAAYHELIHGDSSALLGTFPTDRRGELFHEFVAHLKILVTNGEVDLSSHGGSGAEGIVRNRFLEFAHGRGFSLDVSSDLWSTTIEPWVRRKLQDGELQQLKGNKGLFFEITVANPRLPVELGQGVRHYPLSGRIDEIDIENKNIIERTIKTSRLEKPPLLKDFQVWLLWKIISSLSKEQLPAGWSEKGFDSLNLIVETPEVDYRVPITSPNFLALAHQAFAWIHDISLSESPGVTREVFANAACTAESPHQECGHVFRNCYHRVYPYPQSRPEIKRVFQPWYRLLLWERIWQSDLWWYQLLMVPKPELIKRGLISEARILSSIGNRAEIEIIRGGGVSVRGFDRYTLVSYGTLFCGKRIGASFIEAKKDNLIMELQPHEGTSSNKAILLPSPPEATSPIMQPPPDYLMSAEQKGLFKLQRAGVILPEKAETSSVVQLLESFFGIRKMRRKASA